MNEIILEKIGLLAVLLAAIAMWSWMSKGEYEIQRVESEEYCFMVELWRQSNGENGWPDYEHKYDEVCK